MVERSWVERPLEPIALERRGSRRSGGTKSRSSWHACEELAREERILDRFAVTLERSGVVGESGVAKLLYFALTSRLLNKPVSVVVKGPSSGGKSYLTENVLCFFPESVYHSLTAMTERVLAYSEEPIKHRFLGLKAASLSSICESYNRPRGKAEWAARLTTRPAS